MDKKVSIIIPTYKRSDFLIRAINSVLDQTYKNIEIIVVDDNAEGSEDRKKTEEKMLIYASYENVIYLKNKTNLGGAFARNEGIMKASGYYITFLDDDDVYFPDKVKSQVSYMDKEDLDLSFTDVRIHNRDNKLVDYREHCYIESLANDELLKQHLMHHLTPTGTYMFKLDALKKVGCFDDVKVGQEFMLMLKSIENGLRLGYLPVCHVIQYIHDNGRISVGENKLKAEIELFNLKKEYFEKLNYRQRTYIKFRHNAVMTVVCIRSKKFQSVLGYLIKTVLASPVDCFLESIRYVKKIRNHKKSALESRG